MDRTVDHCDNFCHRYQMIIAGGLLVITIATVIASVAISYSALYVSINHFKSLEPDIEDYKRKIDQEDADMKILSQALTNYQPQDAEINQGDQDQGADPLLHLSYEGTDS